MYILESQLKKILMWVTAHLPLYCWFNCIQYPDLPGQLLISKAAKSANKTGHKGHVSNTQAEDHKLNYHTAHFCIAVKIILALLQLWAHLSNPHIRSYRYQGPLDTFSASFLPLPFSLNYLQL